MVRGLTDGTVTERVGIPRPEPARLWTSGQNEPDDATKLMVETLEAGLARLRERPVRIREMRRAFLTSSSSFRTERLHLTLDAGRPVRVFFKDLHPNHQMEKARTVRGFDLEPSHREVLMYQGILSPERFGTLHLYAFRWQPQDGLFWVFLEDGGRTVLHNYLDLPFWTAAARWAAGFHAATRDLPPAQTRFLPKYDEAHYRRCAERVQGIVANLEPGEQELVTRGLACFRARIAWLAALPRSVIHGQYFGKNIMLRRARGGGRGNVPKIVVIDWETAALAPGVFDLVSLTAGKWTPEERHAMRVAYFDECHSASSEPLDWEAFQEELRVVALYQSLEWLAWWGQHRSLSRHFARFLHELELVLAETVS